MSNPSFRPALYCWLDFVSGIIFWEIDLIHIHIYPFFLSILLSVSLYIHVCMSHTRIDAHTHTQKRKHIFISPLYAGAAQPEIAGLTPCCGMYCGNVCPNPTEYAINLFLDRIQTKTSLHGGNEDGSTYPGPWWQPSHYEAAGGRNKPGIPLTQGLTLRSVPVCITFSENNWLSQ